MQVIERSQRNLMHYSPRVDVFQSGIRMLFGEKRYGRQAPCDRVMRTAGKLCLLAVDHCLTTCIRNLIILVPYGVQQTAATSHCNQCPKIYQICNAQHTHDAVDDRLRNVCQLNHDIRDDDGYRKRDSKHGEPSVVIDDGFQYSRYRPLR